ncbi:MAG: HAD family hydrolase [Limnochordia bacterium]|jgi:HAD superfamily hydrolase (TIGR01484 family)
MVRHVICDIDGCLIPPRGAMWDFTNLEKVAAFNRDGQVRVALCSGRPPAFQEALARQLLVAAYCICENGALLMHPLTKDLILHPNVPQEFMRKRPEIVTELHELVEGTDVVVEFGKEVLISVNPPDKEDLPDLVSAVAKALRGLPIELFNSGRSVEVVPHGVTKDAGLALWAEIENVPIDEITSIGDADNDLAVLEAAGQAAAPANCTPAVRAIVDYVSEYPMVAGVVDILSGVVQGAL